MKNEVRIKLNPEQASNDDVIKSEALKVSGIKKESISFFDIKKKSIDGRGKIPMVEILVDLYSDGEVPIEKMKDFSNVYKKVDANKSVIIVGSGPAGMFAALKLIEKGIKPIILERGKDVKARRLDLKNLYLNSIVNPDSNYCFGEGGAGAFSDGKLYTRSKKRGNIDDILQKLVWHGADKEIITDARPHIGTDKLPLIIQNIRQTIIDYGGEYHFGERVNDFIIENDTICGVKTFSGKTFLAQAVVLATGHSARDIYELLDKKNIDIEEKELAIGVRIEHSQKLIDKIQYKNYPRCEFLPAASYKFVEQVNQRGVYSFCMCPGGHIVPSATDKEQVVVNGMSSSKRNGKFANSGVVVQVKPSDLGEEYQKYGRLKMMRFQQDIEKRAWIASGKTQKAPAARLIDFYNRKISKDLPETSYFNGIVPADLYEVLGANIAKNLAEALKKIGDKMRGFFTNDAILIGVETRTSAPVRIPRDENFQHIQIKGLFPCSEGAGYAGGIISAAIDGENVAKAIASFSF